MSSLNISTSKDEKVRDESNHEVNIKEEQNKALQEQESTENKENHTKEIEIKESITKQVELQPSKIYFINENAKDNVENNNQRPPSYKPNIILDMRTGTSKKTQNLNKMDLNVARSVHWPWWKPEDSTKTQKRLKRLQQKYEMKQHNIDYPKSQPLYPPQGQQPLKVLFGFAGESSGDTLDYDPESRNTFVFVVLLIVMIMLIMTAMFLFYISKSEDLQIVFIIYPRMILFIATFGLFFVNYSFVCYMYTRKPPCCIIMLILTVVFMSLIMQVITSRYRTEVIFYAALITAVIVLVCCGLALTSFDFTAWYLYVVIIGIAVSLCSIIAILAMTILGSYFKKVHIGILFLSVLIESVMLVIELQMILGNKAIKIGEDDWAFAAYMVYTSIIDIFLKMVQLLSLLED